jgi:hypothetical protein
VHGAAPVSAVREPGRAVGAEQPNGTIPSTRTATGKTRKTPVAVAVWSGASTSTPGTGRALGRAGCAFKGGCRQSWTPRVWFPPFRLSPIGASLSARYRVVLSFGGATLRGATPRRQGRQHGARDGPSDLMAVSAACRRRVYPQPRRTRPGHDRAIPDPGSGTSLRFFWLRPVGQQGRKLSALWTRSGREGKGLGRGNQRGDGHVPQSHQLNAKRPRAKHAKHPWPSPFPYLHTNMRLPRRRGPWRGPSPAPLGEGLPSVPRLTAGTPPGRWKREGCPVRQARSPPVGVGRGRGRGRR